MKCAFTNKNFPFVAFLNCRLSMRSKRHLKKCFTVDFEPVTSTVSWMGNNEGLSLFKCKKKLYTLLILQIFILILFKIMQKYILIYLSFLYGRRVVFSRRMGKYKHVNATHVRVPNRNSRAEPAVG